MSAYEVSIPPDSITDTELADDAVDTAAIQDGAVTAAKAAADVATQAELDAAIAALAAVYQALDPTLTALAAQNWAANSIPVGAGADAVSQIALAANTFLARSSAGNVTAKTITDFALTLLDDADALTARATLGVIASLFEEGGAEQLDVTVGQIDAEASTLGQVPTSQGDGTVVWDAQAGGGGNGSGGKLAMWVFAK